MSQINLRLLLTGLILCVLASIKAQEIKSSTISIERGERQMAQFKSEAKAAEELSPQSLLNDCNCLSNQDGALLICDNFQSYELGPITPQSELWSLWPGATRDANIDVSGENQFLRFGYENGTESDLLMDLGNRTSGVYHLSFRLLTWTQFSGYFNIQHDNSFSGSTDANWAYHVQFINGRGTLRIGGFNSPIAVDTFDYTPNSWNTVTQIIDLDNDIATLFINGSTISQWQFSLGSRSVENQLGAINFYANEDFDAQFLIDNVCMYEVDEGIPTPNLVCEDIGDIDVDYPVLNLSSYKVTNTGTATSAPTKLGYYMSTNTNFTTNDYLIASRDIPALDPGESAFFDLSMDLRDAPVPNNTYFLGYIIDYEDLVSESNEQDNNDCYFLNPRFEYIINRGPDLTCLNLGEYSFENQVLSIDQMEILNTGNEPAPASELGIYLSTNTNITNNDFLIGTVSVPELAVNTSGSFDFQVSLDTINNIPDGNYYVGFLADHIEAIEEREEQNNACNFVDPINIANSNGNANLYCLDRGSFTFDDNFLEISQLTVANNGDVSSGPAQLGIFLSTNTNITNNDILVGTLNLPPLGAGESELYQFEILLDTIPDLEDGTYYLGYRIDYNFALQESNEEDNVCYYPSPFDYMRIVEQANLVCTSNGQLQFDGQLLTISQVLVQNNGLALANNTEVGFYLSTDQNITSNDIFLGEVLTSPLLPEGLVQLDFNVNLDNITNLTSGDYYVGFIIDHLNQVDEANENDNVCDFNNPISYQRIERIPNLTCSNLGILSFDGTFLQLNQLQIENNGNTLSGATEIAFYLSSNTDINSGDFFLGSVLLPALEAGAEFNLDFFSRLDTMTSLPDGDYYAGYIIDYQNRITESNEQDNTCAWTANDQIISIETVEQKPNLLCQSGGTLSIDLENERISISRLQIRNDGLTESGGFYVGYFISDNSTLTINDDLIGEFFISNILPGTFVQFSPNLDFSDLDLTPGDYEFGIIIDYRGQVEELAEDDNANCQWSNSSFSILPPEEEPVACICTLPTADYICDDFESYNLGFFMLQSDCIRTQSNMSGAGDDGWITSAKSFSGNQSLQLRENGQADLQFLLGEKTSGTYTLEWVMLVPSGKTASYTLQGEYQVSIPIVEMIFGKSGNGQGQLSTYGIGFNYPTDQWFRVKQVINLDEKKINIFIHNRLIARNIPFYQNLGTVQFVAANYKSHFYIDDISNSLNVAQTLPNNPGRAIDFPSAPGSTLELKLFPNPANEFLNVSIKNPDQAQLELQLINQFGQRLYQKRLDEAFNQQVEINISQFPKGIYFLTVGNGKQGERRKVLIQ